MGAPKLFDGKESVFSVCDGEGRPDSLNHVEIICEVARRSRRLYGFQWSVSPASEWTQRSFPYSLIESLEFFPRFRSTLKEIDGSDLEMEPE